MTEQMRDELIAAVRQIEVGPFGPNSMAILNRSGFTRLTPSEAEQVADAVLPILDAAVAERDAEIERLREDRDLRATQVEEAQSVLAMVKDRVDDFTYDELASVLEDGPIDDDLGDIIPSPLRRERDAARAALGAVAALADEIEARHTKADPVELMLHYDSDVECEACAEGEGHLVPVCDGCYPSWDGMDGHAVWPCKEAKAAADLRAVLAPVSGVAEEADATHCANCGGELSVDAPHHLGDCEPGDHLATPVAEHEQEVRAEEYAQLDRLPVGSVILGSNHGGAHERFEQGWGGTGDHVMRPTASLASILPARVLHIGGSR